MENATVEIYIVDNVIDLGAAITAIGTNKGVIYICPGTYDLGSTLTIQSNMHLIGAGMDATILRITDSSNHLIQAAVSSSSFSVSHLTLEGKGSPSSNSAVQRGFYIPFGCTYGRISNCRLHSLTEGVYAYASNFCEVLDCRFDTMRGYVGYAQGVGVLLEQGGDHLVRGNRFQDLQKQAIALLHGCSRTIVSSNRIYQTNWNAIFVSSYPAGDVDPCSRNLISNNEVRGVSNRPGDSFTANGIVVSGGSADNVVEGNLVTECDDCGIFLYSPYNATDDYRTVRTSVIGNRIKDISKDTAPSTPRDGIRIEFADDTFVAGNQVEGKYDASHASAAIQIATVGLALGNNGNTDRSRIVGNVVTDSQYGVWVNDTGTVGRALDTVLLANAGFSGPNNQTTYKTSGTRTIIDHRSLSSTSVPVGTVNAGSTSDITFPVSVPGAVVGDLATATPGFAINTGITWQAYVSAVDTVKIRVTNVTNAAIVVGTNTWRVSVLDAMSLV
jgi:hypothetical protein